MNRSNEKSPHLLPSAPSGAALSRPQGAGAGPGLAAGAGNLMNRVKLLLVTGLYVATFLWAYATIVSPAFAYDGCTLAWPDAGAVVWLITLALLPALLLPCSLSRPSGVILWWLYLAVYIPSILVPALTLSMPQEKLWPLQISLLLCMGLLCWASSARLLAINQITVSAPVFWLAFLMAWGTSLGFVLMNGRANVMVTNIASLFEGATEYTIRNLYRDTVLEAGRGLAYVVGQLGNALNPFLIAFGLLYRRRMCLVAGIIGQVIVFSLTGFKTALLSAVFLALVAVFMRRWRRNFGLALTSGLIATILFCAVADRATGNVFFSSMLTRRALTVPGLLTGFYFEHYSHSSLAGAGFHFFHDEAQIGPANEIGLAYFGSVDVNANANLWAEGFAELGLPGIVGYTILVAFFIWIYDSISARRNLELAVLLAAMPAITLSNTAPTTVLISHGGMAAALLLYLSPWPGPSETFAPEIEPEASPLMSTAETSV